MLHYVLIGVIVVFVHEEVLRKLIEQHALDTEFILIVVGQEALELFAEVLVTLQSLHQLLDEVVRVEL